MNPMVKANNLSPEDASVIIELAQKLDIAVVKRLAKGHEKKFYIETTKGEKRLLRINDIKHYDWVKADARMYEYVAASGINVSQPVIMGVCNGGTLSYQLLTWLDGEDLAAALPRMRHTEQFSVGEKSGTLLRKLHTLSPLYDTESWGIRFRRKVQDEIQSYNDNPVKSWSGNLLVQYLQDNQELLDNRPQTFTHGDCNTENFILSPDGQIGIIDLGGGNNCNDPWWEFWEIPCDLNSAAHFYTGQIKGYFEGEPPPTFFRLLSYYIAFGALESIRGFSEEDIPGHVKSVLNWFDNMQNPVPTWYLSQIE